MSIEQLVARGPAAEPGLIKRGTYRQRVATRFATWLLMFIGLTFFGVFVQGWLTAPTVETAKSLLAPEASAAERWELYERLMTQHRTNVLETFQILIGGMLVPLFTLMAGYIFGSQANEASD